MDIYHFMEKPRTLVTSVVDELAFLCGKNKIPMPHKHVLVMVELCYKGVKLREKGKRAKYTIKNVPK